MSTAAEVEGAFNNLFADLLARTQGEGGQGITMPIRMPGTPVAVSEGVKAVILEQEGGEALLRAVPGYPNMTAALERIAARGACD